MNAVLHDTVVRLYRVGKLTEKGLDAAVEKGWITAEEAAALKGGA